MFSSMAMQGLFVYCLLQCSYGFDQKRSKYFSPCEFLRSSYASSSAQYINSSALIAPISPYSYTRLQRSIFLWKQVTRFRYLQLYPRFEQLYSAVRISLGSTVLLWEQVERVNRFNLWRRKNSSEGNGHSGRDGCAASPPCSGRTFQESILHVGRC